MLLDTVTLFDKTLAIEIKYLFGSKKEKLYNTGECMQLFGVVSAEKNHCITCPRLSTHCF